MLRSRSFLSLKALRGCPPVKPKSYPVVHAAQRPAKSSNINFAELGLRFQVTRDPTISTSTLIWSAPPVDPPSLPFMVSRAGRSQGIPVYTEYKSGGTRMVTILKKCRGDIKILKEEMEKVVGEEVTIRPGKLVVSGNYAKRLKKWLIGIGL